MKKYLPTLLLIITFVIAAFWLKTDFSSFVLWWVVILAAGISVMPAAMRLFKGFNDKGYMFAKSLGILAAAWLMWLLSSLKLLPVAGLSAWACVLAIGFAVYFILRRGQEFINFLRVPQNRTILLLEETLLVACLLFWTILRGQKPEISGLEKYMDFGFINSILRTPYAPPNDMWMAGNSINYYYFGQYVSAFITALSGVKAAIAYNLMMASLFAFTFCLSFSLVFNMIRAFYPVNPKKGKTAMQTAGWPAALVGGFISAAGVSLAGNLHTFIYAWLLPLEQKLGLYKNELKAYWFPDATRYIGYDPPTNDKTIHEFPLYSFVVSDLHAHVVNMIFVITMIAVLFAFLTRSYGEKPLPLSQRRWYLPEPEIILAGFFIGIYHMANYWDFPIYFTVTLITLAIVMLRKYGFSPAMPALTLYNACVTLILSELVSLPFTLSFVKIASQIKLAPAHTPFYQLLVLWGCPLIFGIVFLIYIFSIDDDWKTHSVNPVFPAVKPEGTGNTVVRRNPIAKAGDYVLRLINHLHPSDIFAAVLFCCAVGLVVAPEIVYVKDIYEGDYKRANTMFKLTYQSFIMFGLSLGYIFARVGFFKMRPAKNFSMKIILAVLFLLTMIYPFYAVKAWYGALNPAAYKGLDGLTFLKDKYPDDLKAIEWLNENVKGDPSILEADGLSYTDNCRISMATGLPTIVGWFTHEHLWRNSPDLVSKKAEEVRQIYENATPEASKGILQKYSIKYIILGKIERDKFKALNEAKVLSFGDIVFDSATTKIIRVKQ